MNKEKWGKMNLEGVNQARGQIATMFKECIMLGGEKFSNPTSVAVRIRRQLTTNENRFAPMVRIPE